ncbi:MAG: hypothetical protein KKA90_03820 [Nanoarchaeota archaeon]|nr:hypothetical protein [Nanoarchaeota archaeon]
MAPLLELVLYSLLLSFVLSLAYRFLTNPEHLRQSKANVKIFREKMNDAKKAGNTQEMNKYLSEMMKANQVQMKANMKPMIASMIIFFIALGFLASFGPSVVAEPQDNMLQFGEPFNASGSLEDGVLALDQNGNGDVHDDPLLMNGEVFQRGEYYWQVELGETTTKLNAQLARSPIEFPWLGHYLNWFWIYLLVTIPFTIVFRKLLGAE